MVHDERGGDLYELAKIGPLEFQDDITLGEAGGHHIARTNSTARELEVILTSGAKGERRQTDVRVLFAREILTRFFAVAKLLGILVARDGIEPPTPAFSGPPTELPKWFEINECH